MTAGPRSSSRSAGPLGYRQVGDPPKSARSLEWGRPPATVLIEPYSAIPLVAAGRRRSNGALRSNAIGEQTDGSNKLGGVLFLDRSLVIPAAAVLDLHELGGWRMGCGL